MQNEYAERDLETLKEILCRLLSRDSMVDNESIYEAGLTSIMVLPLLAEIENAFQLATPDDDFFEARRP
jgi:acyl carrier protein